MPDALRQENKRKRDEDQLATITGDRDIFAFVVDEVHAHLTEAAAAGAVSANLVGPNPLATQLRLAQNAILARAQTTNLPAEDTEQLLLAMERRFYDAAQLFQLNIEVALERQKQN